MPTTTNTTDDLKTAFAGESQANRKYLAFAKKAQADGFPQVAKLFRAAAEAETIHAMGHLTALGAVTSTADNLKAAVAGETYEYKEMYPPMLAEAQKENHKAKTMFAWALKAEEVHARLYQKALDAVLSGKDLADSEIYLCPVCGHLELGKPNAKCPICNLPPEKYRRME
ncbi:MAG TPA: rubrerythrin [Elusimicrobia bacterium]|nr:rubrerythrin [Elusimicrobiota bacterium]HBT61596.1 rubrerythrin [Elusimicrobiota bacterium]